MFKRTQFIEIKSLNTAELIKKLVAAKSELIDLSLDKNMGKQKDVKSVFKKRKEIAQLSTILRQKQLLGKLENEEIKKDKKGEQIEVVADDVVDSAKKSSKTHKSVKGKK